MKYALTLLLMFCGLTNFAQQQVAVMAESQTLETGEIFSLKIQIRNAESWEVDYFPEIPGFKKEGKSIEHASVKVKNEAIIEHKVTQNYKALTPGTYTLKDQTFTVNGKIVAIPTVKLIIKNGEDPDLQPQLIQKSGNALLFLYVNKKQVYIGEGIKLLLAFYVSEDNTEQWEFPKDLNKEIAQIAKTLKPTNCLENRREITNITGEPAVINGASYIRYTIYEAVYYPLNEEEITLNPVSINMDKVVSTEEISSREKQTFSTSLFKVKVIQTPDSPLQNKVPVGNFKISDLSNIRTAKTGKILNYSIKVSGEGNFKNLSFEPPASNASFDFYTDDQTINQLPGKLAGEKIFGFKVFPKDSGLYRMADYFKFIYFNTESSTYDTLSLNNKLSVTGETIVTTNASNNIYEGVSDLDTSSTNINYRNIVKKACNILLFLMLAGMLLIFEFERKKQ